MQSNYGNFRFYQILKINKPPIQEENAAYRSYMKLKFSFKG